MLDVHSPHKSPDSWREFFVHLATITIGLLIALGLEAAVEWMSGVQARAEPGRTRAAASSFTTDPIEGFGSGTSGIQAISRY